MTGYLFMLMRHNIVCEIDNIQRLITLSCYMTLLCDKKKKWAEEVHNQVILWLLCVMLSCT